ncbi:hypothetical protein [Lactobacillus delbrueckii]|uniref:hypothetical protein n=1 Tax=Lactobacillus delbrueckii TaxID=1584 RepID=UPI0025B24D31|nr:hypothetical protein [Lactobacillus delbrueckii]
MTTKKEIMVNAWEIAREGQKAFGGKVTDYFAQALKMAWAQAKKGLDIEALEKKGFNRWTKGDMDRLYFSLEKAGALEVDYYKSGNLRSAYLNGERISNAEACRLLSVKCFIDLKKGNELVVQYGREDAQDMVRDLAEKAMQ